MSEVQSNSRAILGRDDFEGGRVFGRDWANENLDRDEMTALLQLDASNGLTAEMIATAIDGDPESIFGDGDGLDNSEEFLHGFLAGVREISESL